MKFQVVLLAGMLAASSAFAQGETRATSADHGVGDTQNDTRRTGDTNEQGERVICRMQQLSSTSRMSARRVCRTAAEWRQISQSGHD